MHDIKPYLETLASHAHPAGGWGYLVGQEAHPEPTCLALLALSLEAERYQDLIEQGKEALRRCALPDGSYVLGHGRPEAIWPTALVLFVQAALGSPEEEVQRTASCLLTLQGCASKSAEAAELHDIDTKLVGWAWAENNFSWAEPTAWACLALRRAGLDNHPRVEEGLRLLLDRAQDRGGINYGNRRVFGRITEPIPGPTAMMLLALQGDGATGRRGDAATEAQAVSASPRPPVPASFLHPRVAAAVTYLWQEAVHSEDLEHLCWAKLALDLYRHAPECEVLSQLDALDERIVAAHQSRVETPWLKPSLLREALTALALATERRNFFRIDSCTTHHAPRTTHHAPRTTHHAPWSQRIKSFFRGKALEAAAILRPIPPQSAVHVVEVHNYNADLADILCRQYEAFRAQVPLAGKRVVLKPNLVEYHRDKVINTHPHVVAAAIELCQREGAAEVIVAEGPGHCRNVEHIVSASGLGDVLRHYKVPFVDLNHDEPVKTLNLGRLTRLDYLYVARTIVEADVLISMPKLKTHHWAGVTLSLKNLFGALPGICYGWPKNELHWRGVENSIVDIAMTRTPNLAIVDGIIAMEGDGPLNGTPKPLGVLIMGSDLLAVDATCCRLMQINPERVPYLMMSRQKKLGLLEAKAIQQIGEKIEPLAQPFETLPQFSHLYMNRA